MKRFLISNTANNFFYHIIFVGSDIVEWVIPSTWARGTGQLKDGDEGSGSYSLFLSLTIICNHDMLSYCPTLAPFWSKTLI